MTGFDFAGGSVAPTARAPGADALDAWKTRLLAEGRARKAQQAGGRKLSHKDIEELARQVFAEVRRAALDEGVRLPDAWLYMLIGDLSGLGPLMELIARDDVEDIALNLQHLYAYTTRRGWVPMGRAEPQVGDAIRVLIDRAGQRGPTPDLPIADAMLQVTVPRPDGQGVERKGLRVNYIMPPASPYGDIITIRVSRYRTARDMAGHPLGRLTASRLPPVPRPSFQPIDFPAGDGALSPEAANYLVAVLVFGGTLVVAGSTGSGKTFLSTALLQEMLNFYNAQAPGALRLFVVEDSHEIVLNGWDGDPASDTGNIVYTVTRPAIRGGPPPVTTYDLIRAALRSRPHGIVVGEARGAEAWELVRATATGHGHSIFTIHATSAERVWPRFLQAVQAHPDVQGMEPLHVARGFAEGVAAIVYIERHPRYGQRVMEIAEVAEVVERSAGRPTLTPLFRFDPDRERLLPTGNLPMRAGFRAVEMNLPPSFFRRQGL